MSDPFKPSFLIPVDVGHINLVIPDTQAQLENQDYVFNEAGLSFNEAGVVFGGVYNQNEDIVPLFAQASSITPHISDIVDTAGSAGGRPFSIGPGIFMFVTL